MFEFRFTFGGSDYLAFTMHHQQNNPVDRKLLMISRLAFPVIFIPAQFLSLLNPAQYDAASLVGRLLLFGLVSIAWFFLVPPVLRLMTRVQVRMMRKHGALQSMQNVVLRFEDDSVTEIAGETEVKVRYSGITRITGGPAGIYIYFGPVQAIPVPLSVFQTAKQRDDFWYFIHGKWEAAKEVPQGVN